MSSSAALLDPQPRTMIVPSDLLGPLDIEPDEVFRFPAGLFGFPDSNDFILLPAEQDGLFWLQSTEHSALAFVLIDPFQFFDEYSVDIPDTDLRDLGRPERADLLVLAIVTLPRGPGGSATANLQGPVALNIRTKLGKQIPMADSEYDVRTPFALAAGAE